MWYDEAVFYSLYPLGALGAPHENDGVLCHRLREGEKWLRQARDLGATAVYLGPVFQSGTHGYDTWDYRRVDCRLGDNEDLTAFVAAAHGLGLRVILDGVFNHVGRGFTAFRDLMEKKWDSPYRYWFNVSFEGNSPYNDGFWYEGWEGHYELCRLNLKNPEVRSYLLETVAFWRSQFGIDGLRLDVAYLLDWDFIRALRSWADSQGDFFLLGETLHGDYNRWVNGGMLHSCTNYECYKGFWSALNSYNLFEIVHSLRRQFGSEPWALYRGAHLMSFLDNHDVTRIASMLTEPRHLPLAYGLLFAAPGIPAIYYGSEWGETARKQPGGDWNLRPCLEPRRNALTEEISALCRVKKQEPALSWGSFRDIVLTNRQTVFLREHPAGTVLFALNIDASPFRAGFGGFSRGLDLISGRQVSLEGGLDLEGFSYRLLRIL